MKEMTITEALRELSLYEEKITKAMWDKAFIAAVKTTTNEQTKDTAKKKIKADYESIKKIMDNREKIKSAVIQSNATTMVTINGTEMTVAEAIDKKHSIEHKQKLLNKLVTQSDAAKDEMERHDKQMETEIDNMIMKIAGSEAEDVADKRKVLEEAYRKSHAYELIDPIKIDNEIEKLKDEIDGFTSNVDVALSLSNAVTVIKVDI